MWFGLACGQYRERERERESVRGEKERERGGSGGGQVREHIPAAFKRISLWEVLRFKMASCDVDGVFDLLFAGSLLFSSGETLARSHFRTSSSQQNVGQPAERDCIDRSLSPPLSLSPHPPNNHISFSAFTYFLVYFCGGCARVCNATS